MTKKEFELSKCEGKVSKFTLTSGITLNGMIAAFFPEEPDTYFYVATGNVQVFRSLREKRNLAEMKQLCVQINLSNIVSAEILK